jgi:hypothetical protein
MFFYHLSPHHCPTRVLGHATPQEMGLQNSALRMDPDGQHSGRWDLGESERPGHPFNADPEFMLLIGPTSFQRESMEQTQYKSPVSE